MKPATRDVPASTSSSSASSYGKDDPNPPVVVGNAGAASYAEIERRISGDFIEPASDRSCGDCSLCCKIMTVKEIDKPANKWCSHCNFKGSSPCLIYNSRPQSCVDFCCNWLAGLAPMQFKPNKIKCVLHINKAIHNNKELECVQVYVDPGYPTAWEDGKFGAYLAELSKEVPVVIFLGEERKLLLSSHKTANQFKNLLNG